MLTTPVSKVGCPFCGELPKYYKADHGIEWHDLYCGNKKCSCEVLATGRTLTEAVVNWEKRGTL